MAKAKRLTPPNEVARELEEKKEQPVVEEPVVESVPEPSEEVHKPKVAASFTRDEEGRIVVDVEGLPKRIAGNDAALPETLRQLGEDIIKRNLV